MDHPQAIVILNYKMPSYKINEATLTRITPYVS